MLNYTGNLNELKHFWQEQEEVKRKLREQITDFMKKDGDLIYNENIFCWAFNGEVYINKIILIGNKVCLTSGGETHKEALICLSLVDLVCIAEELYDRRKLNKRKELFVKEMIQGNDHKQDNLDNTDNTISTPSQIERI